jgi:hypothetical protein
MKTNIGRTVVTTIPAIWDPAADARKLAELVAMDVVLTKDARERRYAITPAPRAGDFRTEVWMGRALHQQKTVVGHFDTKQAHSRFRREIEDLIADGWSVKKW